jgi:hypothetical protein
MTTMILYMSAVDGGSYTSKMIRFRGEDSYLQRLADENSFVVSLWLNAETEVR